MIDQFARELADTGFWDFWFWTVILAIFVAGFFADAFVQLRKSRVIRDLPTSKVRSAAQGQVELQGITRQGTEPMASPLSRRPCAWWYYKLEERKRDEDGDKAWVTLESGACETPFVLEDDTGRCLVEPAGAEVIHAQERQWYGRGMEAATTPETSVYFFRRYRFTERYLWYDQPLYALGDFSTLQVPSGADHRLAKPESAPFILSAKPQKQLAGKYRRGALSSYAAFVLLGGLFVALLAARLGVGTGPGDMPSGWRLVEPRATSDGSVVANASTGPVAWTSFKSGQESGVERQFHLQRTATHVGALRRVAFRKGAAGASADGPGWSIHYHYYDCAKSRVSPAIPDDERGSYERNLHLMGGSWLTFAQAASAAFGFRGDPEVVAIACGDALASTVR